MIHIVKSRLPNDKHDWVLIRGGKYKCVLCGYKMLIEPVDTLIPRSGCPKSKAVMETTNA